MVQQRSLRGLDWLNFFVAAVQTGFGPFLSVHLTARLWTQTEIGTALSLGTIISVLSQVPGGALVDAARGKRGAALWSLLGIGVAALLIAVWPVRWPVVSALMLQGFASSVLGPAIAAISLSLVGRALLGERIGRNVRFSAIGNGVAAGVMGMVGTWVSEGAVFGLTAALVVPALFCLGRINGGLSVPPATPPDAPPGWQEIRRLLRDRRLTIFAFCAGAFHLANAAMLPLAAADITRDGGRWVELTVAAYIVVPQIVMALLSPWIGRMAETRGRRGMLLLGWGMLPVRGVLLALSAAPWMLVPVQALGGISAAVYGIMLPLIAADLSHGTRRFNLCMGGIGFAGTIGAILSTTVAGWVADRLSTEAAFLGLGLVGLAGTALVWLAMPETKGGD